MSDGIFMDWCGQFVLGSWCFGFFGLFCCRYGLRTCLSSLSFWESLVMWDGLFIVEDCLEYG